MKLTEYWMQINLIIVLCILLLAYGWHIVPPNAH